MKERAVIAKVYTIVRNGVMTHTEFTGVVEHENHFSGRLVITNGAYKHVGSMIHRIPKDEMKGAIVFETEVFSSYKL